MFKNYFFYYLASLIITGLILAMLISMQADLKNVSGTVNHWTDAFEAAGLLSGYVIFISALVKIRQPEKWKKAIIGLLGIIFALAIPQLVEICIITPFKLNVQWGEGPAEAVGRTFVWITLPIILITWLLPKFRRQNK